MDALPGTLTECMAGEVCPMLLCAMSHLSGSLYAQTNVASGKVTGGFTLREHYEQPQGKLFFFPALK